MDFAFDFDKIVRFVVPTFRIFLLLLLVFPLFCRFGESVIKKTIQKNNKEIRGKRVKMILGENNVLNILNTPPSLSVYDTYGRSESEQTLIGGETGRESDGA